MIALNFLIINPFENLITSFDIFVISSLFILISYLKYIEKPIKRKEEATVFELDIPIYKSKDILLQGKNNYFTKDKNSIWVDLFVIAFVFIVIITPLHELLGIEYFL
ncbi:hypothetical protein [uncultured Tenacibaculum sp.]|uniref:hypothetical protein n=1 Tax=uncultured Tenacibaculum sp. TaxID=174713 RepID=UPI002637356D|nr:hypothetical protein [uncultured Tenacibaculum sp.]